MNSNNNFLIMIIIFIIFISVGVAIAFFCIKRISFHEEEMKKKIPKKKRDLARRNIIIMKTNLIGVIIWVFFFTIRAIISVVNYVK